VYETAPMVEATMRHYAQGPTRWHDAMAATKEGAPMNIQLSLGPLVSLIAGILILIVPRLLNYIVAIYLIIIGLIGIFGAGNLGL
jgi:hypothetical protein